MLRSLSASLADAATAVEEDIRSSSKAVQELGVLRAVGEAMEGAVAELGQKFSGLFLQPGAPNKSVQPGGYLSGRGPALRPFAPGERVTIGPHQFILGEQIGAGRYGCAWSAESAVPDGACGLPRDVVIKEMRCGQGPGILPDASVQKALFEILVMRRLLEVQQGLGPAVVSSPRQVAQAPLRCPALLAHEVRPMGPSAPNAAVCRIAMTRCPGKPLDAWLSSRPVAPATPRQVQAGGNADSDPADAYCGGFFRAAFVGQAMLAQLAPTFQKLNTHIAYHRDVNAGNILVHSQSCGPKEQDRALPEFSLIDFGQSIDANEWRQGAWQVVHATGDARFWTPASWVRFLSGPRAVAQYPMLQQQYVARLDMFALAICTMLTMMRLHAIQSTATRMPTRQGMLADLMRAVQRLHVSWTGLWDLASRSCERLGEYSEATVRDDQAGADMIWDELSQSGIPHALSTKLQELRRDLARLSKLCQGQPSVSGVLPSTWSGIGLTLDALQDMLCEGSSLDWAGVSTTIQMASDRLAV